MTDQDDSPVFDETVLVGQLGGDRQLAKVIVESALGDLPGYLERLAQAVAADDWQLAGRATHTMKGLTAQIGGVRLSRRLKAMDEQIRRSGRVEPAALADLRRDYQVLAEVLRLWAGQVL